MIGPTPTRYRPARTTHPARRSSNPPRWRGWLLAGLVGACIVTGSDTRAADAPANAPGASGGDWRSALLSNVRHSLEDVNEFADAQWRRFVRHMGMHEPRHIAAYSGYGNEDKVWVRGRLLANKPQGGPEEDDGWWDNLQATYQRWESDEVPGATLEVSYGGTEIQTETDSEGYYQAVFRLRPGQPRDDVAIARYRFDHRVLTATHRVYFAPPETEFMIISDMDDTVIHTGITNVLVAAQLTFLHNAKTRKPLAGVGGLYQSLVRGSDGERINPVFYVSNSAWNMWDLLRDFLDLNDLPAGPLLLRDIGFEADTSDHKIETIRGLMKRYAKLPAILVGDSGQHDAEIYARVATEYPTRVKAIYVRDVDPDEPSDYDANVDRIIERSRDLGVPFLRVAHSADIASHAASIGLLPASEIDDVEGDVQRDKRRETLAEEADIIDVEPR